MIIEIDFGGQTAHLIGRRLRQLGVDSRLVGPDEAVGMIEELKPNGIILSGGPASVYEDGAPKIDARVFEMGVPVLGICYGWQLMAQTLGGEVEGAYQEYGAQRLYWRGDLVAEGVSVVPQEADESTVWVSHGDSVVNLPDGFRVVASTGRVKHAAVEDSERNLYGLQFHPEVSHTEQGLKMLEIFAIAICGEAPGTFEINPEGVIDEIRQIVGKERVIFGVSGGVDSTVAAVLTAKAIGDRLIPVYVESGLMRPGTREKVGGIFNELAGVNPVVIEAQEQFLTALKGLIDPEDKRLAVGRLYIDLFTAEAACHPEVKFLGQGTIYSDVIESAGSDRAAKIKSHHNVGGLPPELNFLLLEPLRGYYKDEVRRLGRMVGLPVEVIKEQPFPGPGYAVRIMGEITEGRLEKIKVADEIVVEEIKRVGLDEELFQFFAIMTGIKTTAVKGDGRGYGEVVAVRAYESEDVMTCKWGAIPYEVLDRISTRVVNEVSGISRVVYDITNKPPATMEWE